MRIFIIAVLLSISNSAFAQEKVWTPKELSDFMILDDRPVLGESFLVKGYCTENTHCKCLPEQDDCSCQSNLIITEKKSVSDKGLAVSLSADSLSAVSDGHSIIIKLSSGKIRIDKDKPHIFRVKVTINGELPKIELKEVIE